MGTQSPESFVRYTSVMTRRRWRQFRRKEEKIAKKVFPIARRGIIFLAVAGAVGVTYDTIAHVNGDKGLTRGYAWAAVTSPDGCVTGAFIQTHAVYPDEEVELSIDPQSQEDADALVFDLSGKLLSAGTFRFCAVDGIIFQATANGEASDPVVLQVDN